MNNNILLFHNNLEVKFQQIFDAISHDDYHLLHRIISQFPGLPKVSTSYIALPKSRCYPNEQRCWSREYELQGCFILFHAAYLGSPRIVKLLCNTFKFTKEHILAYGNSILNQIAKNGNVELMKWIVNEFGIAEPDLVKEHGFIFIGPATENKIQMLQYLKERFPHVLCPKIAFQFAAKHGNIEAFDWIIENFDIPAETIGCDNQLALRYAQEEGHSKMEERIKELTKLL